MLQYIKKFKTLINVCSSADVFHVDTLNNPPFPGEIAIVIHRHQQRNVSEKLCGRNIIKISKKYQLGSVVKF